MDGVGATPDVGQEFRRFKERPSQVFIDGVCEHVGRTGQPETHTELFRGRLAKNEPFHRLKQITIDTRLRPDRDLSPCPRCHSPNKFKSGWLVYLHRLEAVAVVGNDCASGDEQLAAEREWNEREQLRNDEDYLLAAVPRLAEWLSQIEAALAVATEASDVARKFRVDGKVFFDRFRRVKSNGGRLLVTEVIQGSSGGPSGLRTSGSTVETRDHDVGTLGGLSALNPGFNPQKYLEDARRRILAHVQPSEDMAFHYVADLDVRDRRNLKILLQGVVKVVVSTLREIDDFRAFLRPKNLAAITEWAEHRFSEFQFNVCLGEPEPCGYRRLEFKGSGCYFQHRVNPVLWSDISHIKLTE